MNANIENLILVEGAGNIGGTGNALANTMTGNTGNNALNGGGGNDTIDGGDGNDTLTGAAGLDILIGGAGDDTINGGADDDQITGGTGNDALVGGAGNDTFIFAPALAMTRLQALISIRPAAVRTLSISRPTVCWPISQSRTKVRSPASQ